MQCFMLDLSHSILKPHMSTSKIVSCSFLYEICIASLLSDRTIIPFSEIVIKGSASETKSHTRMYVCVDIYLTQPVTCVRQTEGLRSIDVHKGLGLTTEP